MKKSLALALLTVALVSCGKGGLSGDESKKINRKHKVNGPKVVTAKNKDKLIIGDPNKMTAQQQAELEGQVNGEESAGNLPLPGEKQASSSGTGVEISSSVSAGANVSNGPGGDSATFAGNARVVIDVIDNDKNELLWSVPVNASYSTFISDGQTMDRRLNFDVNVQKILGPYFNVAGEFQGGWNTQSSIDRKLYGGAGLNLDILGNMTTPGTKPQLLTSFYLLGGQDRYADGSDAAKLRGSFRIELRDIYLTDYKKEDKAQVKLFGKLDYAPSFGNIKDNITSVESGLSILSPSFLSGMRVGVTPTYKYTRTDPDRGGPVEHMHTFNLGFTLDGPKVKINR